MPARTKVRDVHCRKQRAKKVSGVQRLVALTLAKNIKEVDSPFVGKSASNGDVLVAHNMEDCPLLLHSEERPHDEWWLLWGVTPNDSDEENDDDSDEGDSGNYTVTPQAKAVMLFDSCLKWQSERLGRDEEPSRDGRSGFIFRVSRSMKSSPLCAKSLVETKVHTQIARNERLSFVYDFCDASRTFGSFNFVRNAAQAPLKGNTSNEDLRQLYGLDKTLCFTAASERIPLEHDYWSDIYGGP